MCPPSLVKVQAGLPADEVAKQSFWTEVIGWPVLNVYRESLVGAGYDNSAASFCYPQQLLSISFSLLPVVRPQSAVSGDSANVFDHAQRIHKIEKIIGKGKAARIRTHEMG